MHGRQGQRLSSSLTVHCATKAGAASADPKFIALQADKRSSGNMNLPLRILVVQANTLLTDRSTADLRKGLAYISVWHTTLLSTCRESAADLNGWRGARCGQ